MRVLELFAGIGACSVALKRLGIDIEIVDAVEIDKYAIASFNAINGTNFETQDITTYNKTFEDLDLICHGSPCQDFSIAGKQAGGDIGSGTRSSLMYETIRIVGQNRPKYVLWENVKNILSTKHKHNFDAYIDTMNALGYNSYYQVLNAKDYGIPQNRERVYTVSIRKDIDKGNFKFPEKEELKLRLKDMLEDEVDEKYYLSEKGVKYFVEQTKKRNDNLEKYNTKKMIKVAHGYNQGSINDLNICPTLDINFSQFWRGVILEPECVRVGGIFDTEKSKHQAGSVYDKEGISPTLDVMQGGWRQPSIIIKNATKKGYQVSQTIQCNDSMGVVEKNIKVIGNYSPSNHDASRIVDSNGLAPTVKENHGTVTAIIEENNKNAKHQQDLLQNSDGVCRTVPAGTHGSTPHLLKTVVNEQPLRIRKLTPKECWRLMGFSDEDFEKAANIPTSNTQLYKQAGNSIVVNVLEKIFKNLFEED